MTDLPADELRARLTTVLPVGRWVDEVVVGGPYATADDLCRAAEAAAETLTADEVDEVLAHRPPVDVSWSEALVGEDDADRTGRALTEGAATYEARFGRTFVVRGAGRDRREVLDELDRRLKQDETAELADVARELGEVAAVRLRAMVAAESVEARVARAGEGSGVVA